MLSFWASGISVLGTGGPAWLAPSKNPGHGVCNELSWYTPPYTCCHKSQLGNEMCSVCLAGKGHLQACAWFLRISPHAPLPFADCVSYPKYPWILQITSGLTTRILVAEYLYWPLAVSKAKKNKKCPQQDFDLYFDTSTFPSLDFTKESFLSLSCLWYYSVEWQDIFKCLLPRDLGGKSSWATSTAEHLARQKFFQSVRTNSCVFFLE